MSVVAKRRPIRGRETLAAKGGKLRVWASPGRLLMVLVCIVFLTGGGSRADIASLMFLRPFAIGLLALGLLTLSRQHVREFRWLFIIAGATLALAVAHLVPLPASIWQSLPGREIIVAIDQVADLGLMWRPLTMDPLAAQNAFWSLFVVLAALVLAVQLDTESHQRVLLALICMGLISAVLAVLQLVGDPRSGLYLYRITNNGFPVGLFANRNHQAVFLACILPLAAAWISTKQFDAKTFPGHRHRLTVLGFVSLAITLTVLILVTGSRGGILALLIAILGAVWLLGWGGDAAQKATLVDASRNRRNWSVSMVLATGAAVAIAAYLGRDLALDRLFATLPGEERRSDVAQVATELISLYSPLGSGMGSFEAVYKIHEPDELLGPSYVNHVHNDYLEVALTLGIPGLALLAFTGIAALAASWRCLKRPPQSRNNLSRGSVVVLFVLATASLWDYPLRVPSLQVVGMLAAVWLARSAGHGARRVGRPIGSF